VNYRHTQGGRTRAIVAVAGVTAVLLTPLRSNNGADEVVGAIAVFLVVMAIIVVCNRLTVAVADGEVRTAFGWGWPSRTLAVAEITAFRSVRNRWFYGWGIRKVPGGWMYNVWGLDAIELDLRSGKRFRIGADQPEALMSAISAHTSIQPSTGP
jgi:hypothetical protein